MTMRCVFMLQLIFLLYVQPPHNTQNLRLLAYFALARQVYVSKDDFVARRKVTHTHTHTHIHTHTHTHTHLSLSRHIFPTWRSCSSDLCPFQILFAACSRFAQLFAFVLHLQHNHLPPHLFHILSSSFRFQIFIFRFSAKTTRTHTKALLKL